MDGFGAKRSPFLNIGYYWWWGPLNVLGAKRSLCLNVGHYWWWGPYLNVFGEKVTIRKCVKLNQ